MSHNLIATLRQAGHDYTDAAAAEIEKLRAALRDLLTPQTPASFAGAMIRARAALGEKE